MAAIKPETSDAADPRPSVTLHPAIPSAAPASGPAVYRAIAAITAELGRQGIAKEGTVKEGGNYKYRGVDQVYAALSPLLAMHNLCILPRCIEREQIERKTQKGFALYFTTVKAEFDLVSSEDGSKHTVCTYGEAMDTSDKSTNKAMAVAFKYAAFLMFCIPVEGEDNDPDAHGHEDIVPETKKASAPQQQTKPTEDEMRAAFKRGEDRLKAAKTADAVKTIWDTEIEWDTIPKGWTKQMQKVASETIAAITAAKQRPIVPPNFGPETDDDIPF